MLNASSRSLLIFCSNSVGISQTHTAVWVCDMPTELEQKIRRDLDEAFNKTGWKPRPLSAGNPDG